MVLTQEVAVRVSYPLPNNNLVGDIMLVSDAAQQLGMNTQTLRLALQQDKFPFGKAIRTSPNRFTYFINEEALKRYLRGELW